MKKDPESNATKGAGQQQGNEKADFQTERLTKHRKKRKQCGLMLIISFLALIVLEMGQAYFIGDPQFANYMAYAFIGIETLLILYGIQSGGFRCPYCGALLFRNTGSHCLRCGKKL